MRRRGESGQALAEYGILLALIAGAQSLKEAAGTFLADPWARIGVGVALGALLFFVVLPRRRY
jgi:hypothetical protein